MMTPPEIATYVHPLSLPDALPFSLGAIKKMGRLPDALFVIDIGHEDIAIKEARKLGIPDRRGRHQLRPGPGRLPDPGQRRRHSRRAAVRLRRRRRGAGRRSEEHTSEIQSLMRISYAVFGLQ